MDADIVADRLGLAEDERRWLIAAHELPEPVEPLVVPQGEDARRVWDEFALAEEDRAELARLWPGPGGAGWSPEVWFVVEGMYRRLAADADLPVGSWVDWPALVGHGDPRVRSASLVAFAARVPAQYAAHGALGVDPAVTRATLADVGVQTARSRRMYGRSGVETASWVAAQFRGRLFWVGGLQLEPAVLGDQGGVEWYPEGEAAGLGVGMAVGDPVLRLHIPTGGLDPVSVTDALGRARPFARAHLGIDPVVATCTSWLLDPRWGEVLGEGSNIVSFQRRFTLVGRGQPGEADVFRFVFGMSEVDVVAAPRRTRLERAAVERVEGGGGWQVRTGWLPLPV
ncbi:acyltransferase domain-containing protein [Nocardiopsis lambiniae]|uniref:Acyltransferase domain-containing protein n=1 Tax=Nocardiopsis lambiniae TaxID=3075539 RepID=A0ABU2MC34_9ACTN|nr:acyltransferase domain-containing protein [Nocardiopsis sp. DSM 44743]MDT0330243.1 acyltransferase domain-containing protein [Nocardiopsis sp. DSM 44743]